MTVYHNLFDPPPTGHMGCVQFFITKTMCIEKPCAFISLCGAGVSVLQIQEVGLLGQRVHAVSNFDE